MDYKVCKSHENPDLWYSDRKREQRKAIELCGTCPFQLKCRELGKGEEFGIWGGVLAAPETAETSPHQLVIRQRRVLVEKYTDQGLTAQTIADLLGTSERNVQRDQAALRAAA